MPNESQRSERIAEILLAACAILGVVALALGIAVVRLSRAHPRVQDLGVEDRERLVREARRVSPSLYESFLGIAPPGFYRLAPSTRYDKSHPAAGPAGVLGDEFTTNALGFRTVDPAKPPGVKRIVLVGDSWTFGPGVAEAQTFGSQLAGMLNESGDAPGWQVFALATMGWNTGNEIAALRTFLPWLAPDYVVFCVTSNDIDDSFEAWNGNLVGGLFQSGAVFRRSYEFERRWIENLQALDAEARFLGERGVPMLVYFLAEWRGLAPYYAAKAGLRTPWVVVPTPFIVAPYRLAPEVDAGQHANAEGHRRIAGYLHDALVALGWTKDGAPREPEFPVRLTPPEATADAADAEFAFWSPHVDLRSALQREGGMLGRETIVSAKNARGAARVVLEFELLDEPWLYPLGLKARLLAPEPVAATARFERFEPGVHTLELGRPAALDGYDFVEVKVVADRVVSTPGHPQPVALRFVDLVVQ
ncbi:MAG TPA: SGNH/GDSL hydrolase family protein [Myxococcota bacterium]|nr:SGNH/GDSL hydrolase family protein [Myxococcota bacterium]